MPTEALSDVIMMTKRVMRFVLFTIFLVHPISACGVAAFDQVDPEGEPVAVVDNHTDRPARLALAPAAEDAGESGAREHVIPPGGSLDLHAFATPGDNLVAVLRPEKSRPIILLLTPASDGGRLIIADTLSAEQGIRALQDEALLPVEDPPAAPVDDALATVHAAARWLLMPRRHPGPAPPGVLEWLERVSEPVAGARSAAAYLADAAGRPVSIYAGLDLVYHRIPAGTYRLGGPEADNPPRLVRLSGDAFIQATEFTHLHRRLVSGNAMPAEDPRLPVTKISWPEAMELSAATAGMLPADGEIRISGRLPSESEWTVAAQLDRGRPGARTPPGSGRDITDYAVFGRSAPLPARSRRRGALGLYDVLGNVREWCLDWYTERPAASGSIDPVQLDVDLARDAARKLLEEPNRVRMGGGFESPPDWLDPNLRDAGLPDARYENLGFRAALLLGDANAEAHEAERTEAGRRAPDPAESR